MSASATAQAVGSCPFVRPAISSDAAARQLLRDPERSLECLQFTAVLQRLFFLLFHSISTLLSTSRLVPRSSLTLETQSLQHLSIIKGEHTSSASRGQPANVLDKCIDLDYVARQPSMARFDDLPDDVLEKIADLCFRLARDDWFHRQNLRALSMTSKRCRILAFRTDCKNVFVGGHRRDPGMLTFRRLVGPLSLQLASAVRSITWMAEPSIDPAVMASLLEKCTGLKSIRFFPEEAAKQEALAYRSAFNKSHATHFILEAKNTSQIIFCPSYLLRMLTLSRNNRYSYWLKDLPPMKYQLRADVIEFRYLGPDYADEATYGWDGEFARWLPHLQPPIQIILDRGLLPRRDFIRCMAWAGEALRTLRIRDIAHLEDDAWNTTSVFDILPQEYAALVSNLTTLHVNQSIRAGVVFPESIKTFYVDAHRLAVEPGYVRWLMDECRLGKKDIRVVGKTEELMDLPSFMDLAEMTISGRLSIVHPPGWLERQKVGIYAKAAADERKARLQEEQARARDDMHELVWTDNPFDNLDDGSDEEEEE